MDARSPALQQLLIEQQQHPRRVVARVVALLGIACMISPDMGKSRVHMKLVNFLKDMGEICTYVGGYKLGESSHQLLMK
ncbi:hypothetical protein K1719_016355 [Acacia pycnantha]|nr:hypothetical protein K1719_016355 [Acacia pycnantha]